MSVLQTLRNLPESRRKIIFWLVLIIIIIAMAFLWIQNAQKKFKNFDLQKIKQDINIPLNNLQ